MGIVLIGTIKWDKKSKVSSISIVGTSGKRAKKNEKEGSIAQGILKTAVNKINNCWQV
jgi:hypothetical protein